jgi:SAM-dependent methyltransferase
MEVMRPSPATTILDLGVSLDETSIEANILEQLYPYRHNIVCAGLPGAASTLAQYPDIRFVTIEPHKPLPFRDAEFDVVYSNAVVEHVGTRGEQAAFINEAARVGRRVFIVVPNRLFPVEHHTGLPLIHYLPLTVFRTVLRRSRWEYWASEAHLNPLSRGQFRALFGAAPRVKLEFCGIGVGPFRSNILAYTP